jgi:hypothetical protein
MTDQLKTLFEDLRAHTLTEIVAPGAPKVRATVRRRRGTAVAAGAGFAVATVAIGVGVGLYPGDGGGDHSAAAPDEGPSPVPSGGGPVVMPDPTGPEYDLAEAAGNLLADRSRTPTSINATNGVVSATYENHMNDMPADTYAFRFFCVGTGKVDVVVKQGDEGDTVLGQGSATCAATSPSPLELTINQPTYGYLRIYAAGDAAANERAGFAFEFLSKTGKTTFGPSGPPHTFTPSGGSIEPPTLSASPASN